MKLIERIKKYQRFFTKLEKKQKYGSRKMNAMQAFRGIPGISKLFNADGEVDLNVNDIKLGHKLDLMEKIDRMSKGDAKLEAKLSYYKNLKPRAAVFQT